MATADYFLKLEGVKGESQDEKHKDEIDILSFSWGASQAGAGHYGGGSGAGKVQFQDLHVTMRVNSASPTLYLKCAEGKHIPKGKLTIRKAGGKQEPYLTYELEDILISSINSSGHDGGGAEIVPTEQVLLNFSKIKMVYKPQTREGGLGGPIEFGWDIKKGVKA